MQGLRPSMWHVTSAFVDQENFVKGLPFIGSVTAVRMQQWVPRILFTGLSMYWVALYRGVIVMPRKVLCCQVDAIWIQAWQQTASHQWHFDVNNEWWRRVWGHSICVWVWMHSDLAMLSVLTTRQRLWTVWTTCVEWICHAYKLGCSKAVTGDYTCLCQQSAMDVTRVSK